MKWYNRLQYIAMLVMAAAIPVEMHVALWASVLLALTSVVAMVAGRSVGNRSLCGGARWGLLLMAAYWLLLLVSMLYTTDAATGWSVLRLKGVLLIFSLAFLLADTGWLTPRRLRGIGYAFLAAMVGVMLYHVGVAVGKMLGGASLASVSGVTFDPRHHTYTAAYLAAALVFIYHELHLHWDTLPRWLRGCLIAAVPLLILYVIMVNSRAGMLVLYALEAACVVHFALTRRLWWRVLLLAVLLGGYTVGMEVALPSHEARIVSTVNDLASDDPKDVRLDINEQGLTAASGSPVIGYGVGDYHQHLLDQYDEGGFFKGLSSGYNSHNQYIETLMAIGVIGLLLFVAMLFCPLLQAWRRRCKALWTILLLTFVVAFNLLFESMLERQMGLLYIGYLLAVMNLTVSCEENKFATLSKK